MRVLLARRDQQEMVLPGLDPQAMELLLLHMVLLHMVLLSDMTHMVTREVRHGLLVEVRGHQFE